MGLLLELGLWAVAAMLLLPCAVFFLECALGSRTRRPPASDPAETAPRPRIAVLVPAHDESAGIAQTLRGLHPELTAADQLLVVADNCSDDTAQVARQHGALVVERSDAARRGKGYALAYGLEQLAADPPEVVVIIDADCSVAPGAIGRIARLAKRTDCPVQADYLLQAPTRPQGLAVISALAFLVKNRVRPRGLHAMGFPCLLTGTGMAFPWHVIRKAPPTEGNLVEDMVMGLDLARLGHPPVLCPEARVSSVLPERTQAAHAQRRRWEHGHLATLVEHGPRLFFGGIRQGRPGLVALAFDLMVPPLSLLVFGVLVALCLALLAAVLGASPGPALTLGTGLVLLTSGVVIAWHAHGRETVTARELAAIPLYVLWKLPLYFSFLARGRHGSWERTERPAERPGE